MRDHRGGCILCHTNSGIFFWVPVVTGCCTPLAYWVCPQGHEVPSDSTSEWPIPPAGGDATRSARTIKRSLKTEDRNEKPVRHSIERLFARWDDRQFIKQIGQEPPVTFTGASGLPSLQIRMPLARASKLASGEWPQLISTTASVVEDFDGEFDPGSGRTLAARLIHASRTSTDFGPYVRVANG